MNAQFNKYLDREDVTQKAFAKAIGVREATVTAWKGGTVPRSHLLPKIESETKGFVSVGSWFEQHGATA